MGNIGGLIGPKLYSSLATCLFADGSRGAIGAPCPPIGDQCQLDPMTGKSDCEASYLYAHFSMAGWMFLAFAFGLIIKRFGKVDEEVRLLSIDESTRRDSNNVHVAPGRAGRGGAGRAGAGRA